MKRLLTALIAMAILVTIAPVAMAEHSEPILFRGIPWGSLRSDVVGKLPEPKDARGPTNQKYVLNIEKFIYGTSKNQLSGDGDAHFYEHLSYYKDKITYVAGYEVSSISLFYAYSVDSDGHPDTNFDNGKLFATEYCIYPTNKEAVHEDLVNKLTKLYGDPDYKSDPLRTKKNTYTVWKGKDGTYVSLNLYESEKFSAINIRYATQEGFAMQNEVLKAIKKMETSDADDTSGL